MIESFRRLGPVVDGHADTVQRFVDESWDFTGALGDGMLNLESAQRGGLDGEFFAIWVDPTEYPGRYAHRALQLIDAVHQQVDKHSDQLELCTTADAIEEAHTAGRFAVLLAIEGGHCIENDLSVLRTFYRLGCRYMTLTWTHSVGWADSSGDIANPGVAHANGLTAFGREVIAEMNRLGMMVDVSHVSDETFWEVLRTSSAPVIASHSSARALTAAPRNLDDDQLRAVRDNGGLVMVNFFSAFIDESWRQAWNALKPERDLALQRVALPFRERGEPVPFGVTNVIEREFAARLPRPPLTSLVDHIQHILEIAGPEHVGIGSDFDGMTALPDGIDSAADLPRLSEALLARGVTQTQLQALLGGNLLRVFRAAERVARENR